MEAVLTTISGDGVATITLNRPEQRNAFDDKVIEALQSALDDVSHNNQVRIIVLQAKGKHFSAGADLDWMKRMRHFSEEENVQDALQLMTLLKTLANLPKPVIAVAQGSTFGGGVGLLACCDIVLAADTAQFCFSEAKLGLIPATIAPYIIRAIGFRASQYLFLTAKMFDVTMAQQLGLVQEIAPEEQLQAQCQRLCAHLLQNGPNALHAIKKWLRQLNPMDDNLLTKSAELIAKIRVSAEAQEGLAAFIEKRTANWTNKLEQA